MAGIAAGDVTYTINSQTVSNFSIKTVMATIAFGDGAKTYPTGGIPLTYGSLGLPNTIQALDFLDLGTTGFMASWDSTNKKLRLFQRDSHGHSLFLKDAAQTDAAGNRVNVAASNKLGANTGTSITVAASDGATNGGVVTNAGTGLTELPTSATPTCSFVIRASGY